MHFLGAAQSVTGSKFLLDTGKSQVLFDCGLFQGLKKLRQRNWEPLPMPAKDIEAVVLTHAHIDHSGYIPRLAKQGFSGPVFCTPATRELLGLLLPDAGYLQEEEARFANKHGFSKHSPALPLYTREDAQASLGLLKTLDYGQETEVAPGVKVKLHPSGHILGSAFVEVSFEGRRMVVSGDLGGYENIVMRGPSELPKNLDYILVESTYGGRKRDNPPVQQQLAEMMKPVLDAGRVVVIPAFAVGRTSLLLYHIRQLQERGGLPDVPVFVDSPMATDAVKIYRRFRLEHNLKIELLGSKDCPIRARRTHLVRSADDSKDLNSKEGPMVIISASGMISGGRILHHIKHRIQEPENMILMVGYQAVGTRGRALLDGAETIRIHGENIPVKAKVAAIHGLSAHGDSDDLIDWLRKADPKPKKVFLVHGEKDGIGAMAKRVGGELHMKYFAPDYLESVEL